MIYSETKFRPKPTYPTYPPYHVGDYLEDYFYKKFIFQNPTVSRDYIAISWTTLYCENKKSEIQGYLDSLPKDKKYFTISQHDDAPQHILPKDTLCFSAGGNISGKNIIPIPLICSNIPKTSILKNKKELTASFVGSITHPIRIQMAQTLFDKPEYEIWIKQWSPSINKSEFDLFLELASKSKYLLCPRGYGLNSFRLYEAFQLNCVPVIITDKPYLPWSDELNWNDFSVFVDAKDVGSIDSILKNIDSSTYEKLLNNGQAIYSDYFTLDGMYNNIIKRIS